MRTYGWRSCRQVQQLKMTETVARNEGGRRLLELLMEGQSNSDADLMNKSGIARDINRKDAANMLRAIGELREKASGEVIENAWRELS